MSARSPIGLRPQELFAPERLVVPLDAGRAGRCEYHDCGAAASVGASRGGVLARSCTEHAEYMLLSRDGSCCSCGYAGAEETECPSREDRTHCEHWWDGPEEKEGGPT